MGGSLGATAMNDVLDAIMPKLTKKFDVAHIRGKKKLLSAHLPKGYKQFGYVGSELGDLYAAADIMLSREGATAIFEILALNLPALLIPLPKLYSRGDQIQNAEHFQSEGYCHVLPQEHHADRKLSQRRAKSGKNNYQ